MATKAISTNRTVDLDRSRMVLDNGLDGDGRLQLWVEGDGEAVWIETNGDPIADADEIAETLVDAFGLDPVVAESVVQGDLSSVDAKRSAKVKLLDYGNARCDDGVVLFVAGVGYPTGEYFPLNHPDYDFPDRNGLLELTGTIDESGDWQWDGEGNPTDDRRNTIYKLHACVDPKKWGSLIGEYESEGL